MKTDREQIRKVADALSYECQQSKTCDGCFARGRVCSDYKTAEKLYKAGSRKATEVIDEIVERLKEENEISFRRYGKGIGISTIFRIAAEMRQEVEN